MKTTKNAYRSGQGSVYKIKLSIKLKKYLFYIDGDSFSYDNSIGRMSDWGVYGNYYNYLSNYCRRK